MTSEQDHFLLHYYEKLRKHAQRHYELTLETGDEEAIHDLRVELKKIRALYFFVEALTPDFRAKKSFKAQKKLFNAVGEIRDFQVPDGLARKYGKELDMSVAGFHKFLLNGIKQSQEHFEIWLKQADVNVLENSSGAIIPLLQKISNTKMMNGGKKMIRHLFEQIKVLEQSKNEEDWHKIRILLKRAHYIIDIMEAFRPFYPSGKMKLIKLLEQLLGDWHDLVITSAKLKEYQNSRKPSPHYDPMTKAFKKDGRHLVSTSKIYLNRLV